MFGDHRGRGGVTSSHRPSDLTGGGAWPAQPGSPVEGLGEVGDQGPAFHREVGAYAKQRGIETLWCAGELTTHAAQAFGGARHFATVAEIVAAVKNHEAPACRAVVVKGSRFMRMEQVVAALAEGGAHAA